MPSLPSAHLRSSSSSRLRHTSGTSTVHGFGNRKSVATAALAGTLSATGIIPLGYDFLTFLTATVLVVPACKWLKLSPVLGFLAAGVLLEQAG